MSVILKTKIPKKCNWECKNCQEGKWAMQERHTPSGIYN